MSIFTFVRIVAVPIYIWSLIQGTSSARVTLFILGVVTEEIAALFLFYGFQKFSKIDSQKFSKPTHLIILMLVGLPTLMVGGVIDWLWAQSLGGAPLNVEAIPHFEMLIEGFVLFTLGGIIGIIGILGAMQGLWRIGERYGRTSIKLGAILYVVPYASIASVILLIFGVRRATRGFVLGEPRAA